MIEFKNVFKEYDNNSAINGINLTINDGDFFVMVGPSGSGKTTTLKMINRLIDRNSGDILIDGKSIDEYDIQKMRLQMGYVLQNIALFPNLTIEENITIQPESLGWSKEKRHSVAFDLLKRVGLDPNKYAHRLPNELSGGEQQRVGIVRALATSPQIVLMDEPFSALDPISRNQLQELVLNLHKELKMTFIFVTHDMTEALRLGSTIAVMRKGKIEQIGSKTEIFNHPKNDFVRGFFKNEHQKVDLVGDLLNKKYCKTIDNVKSSIDYKASISDLAKLLQNNEVVVASDEVGQKWQIKTSDLIKYLAGGK